MLKVVIIAVDGLILKIKRQYLIKNGKVYDVVEEKEAKAQFDQLLLDEFSFILSHPKLSSD